MANGLNNVQENGQLRHTNGFAGWLDKFFGISAHRSTIRREVIGGIVTFLSMAYILIVNPIMLGDAGMSFESVFMATALSAAGTTILMGFLARLPLALAPGMGLNAFFTYNVALGMGFGWEKALAVVLVSGILFLIISITGVRSKALNAIPKSVKAAMGAGIGFFIAFIGLANAGIVKADPATIVGIGNLTEPGTILAIIGIVVMIAFFFLRVKGYMFVALVLTLLVGLGMTQFGIKGAGLPSLDGLDKGWGGNWAALGDTFGKAFSHLGEVVTVTSGWIAIIIFLFIDFFDSAGTLVAAGQETGMMNESGEIHNAEKALLVDAIGTVGGAVIGTSTVTAFVESNAGIAQGARTGLSAVVVGLMFFLSVFISPIFGLFTGPITALALVGVGMLMITQLKEIEWEDHVITFTTFVTVLMMVLTYAIHWGIVFGFIVYTISMLASRRHKEVKPTMYVLAILSVIFVIVEMIAKY